MQRIYSKTKRNEKYHKLCQTCRSHCQNMELYFPDWCCWTEYNLRTSWIRSPELIVCRRYNPSFYRHSPIETYVEACLGLAQVWKMMLNAENVNGIKMLIFFSGKSSILNVLLDSKCAIYSRYFQRNEEICF